MKPYLNHKYENVFIIFRSYSNIINQNKIMIYYFCEYFRLSTLKNLVQSFVIQIDSFKYFIVKSQI